MINEMDRTLHEPVSHFAAGRLKSRRRGLPLRALDSDINGKRNLTSVGRLLLKRERVHLSSQRRFIEEFCNDCGQAAVKRLDAANRTSDCCEDSIKSATEAGYIRDRYLDPTAPP
jgi:hypothetical protein